MSQNYQYHYAYIEDDGLCTGDRDTSNYILNKHHVPVPSIYDVDYLLKYYWPIPATVTSFNDWQGLWYLDAAHTQLFTEGNV